MTTFPREQREQIVKAAVTATCTASGGQLGCTWPDCCNGLEANFCSADAVRACVALDAALPLILEACAKSIPSNWCDPLLTGDDAALPAAGDFISASHIERLLQGCASRLRSLIPQKDETQ